MLPAKFCTETKVTQSSPADLTDHHKFDKLQVEGNQLIKKTTPITNWQQLLQRGMPRLVSAVVGCGSIAFLTSGLADSQLPPSAIPSEQVAAEPAATQEHDILLVRAHQLDPRRSSSVRYYDQIITNEFRRFLSTYPHSPYEAEVTDQIKNWQAERDQVAAGRINDNSDWVAQADYERYQRWEQVKALLDEAEQDFAQKHWPEASRKYGALLVLWPAGGAAVVAKRQLAVSLDSWQRALEKRQIEMEHYQQAVDRDVTQAQRAVKGAQAGYNQTLADLARRTVPDAGSRIARSEANLNRVQSQFARNQFLQTQIHNETAVRTRQLSEIVQLRTASGLGDICRNQPVEEVADPVIVWTQIFDNLVAGFRQNWMIFTCLALTGVSVVKWVFR